MRKTQIEIRVLCVLQKAKTEAVTAFISYVSLRKLFVS